MNVEGQPGSRFNLISKDTNYVSDVYLAAKLTVIVLESVFLIYIPGRTLFNDAAE